MNEAPCSRCNGGLVCGGHSSPDCYDCELDDDQGWATMRYCPRYCKAAFEVSSRVGKRANDRYGALVWGRLVKTTVEKAP